MDKLEKIIRESARQAAQDVPLDAMWEALRQAARVKREKRMRVIRQASMAAMLVIALGIGVLMGRSPMFAPQYVVVAPPKTDEETTEPVTIPDNVVVDPPKTDSTGDETITCVMRARFENLPVTDSVKDLLPGWLPDTLRDKLFTMDAASGYWKMQNQDDPNRWITFELSIAAGQDRADWVDAMLQQDIVGLPEGYSAKSMEIGTGFLLRYDYGSEEIPALEYWILRVAEDTYVQCIGTVSREDCIKIIENLGK